MAGPLRGEPRGAARAPPARPAAARALPRRRARRKRRSRRRSGAAGDRGAARPPAARRGRGGDVPGEGASHPRPPLCAPRPARLGAARRPGARPRPARAAADARAHGPHPGERPAPLRPGGDAGRGAAGPARDVLRDDGVRARAHLEPRAAALAAGGDRVGHVPPPVLARREEGAPRPAVRRRGLRALPPPRVPGPEAVLDRRARRDGADARRGDRAGGRRRRAPRRARHGAPRPAQRPRPHGRPRGRRDPARVRGRARPRSRLGRPGERLGRCEVPPRRRGRPRDAERRGHGLARVEPEPPRVRRPGRRGGDACVADRSQLGRRRARSRGGARDPHPRRRCLPRPGSRGRDAQPPGARGLQDGRDAAHHRQQPGGLHDRSRRGPLDPLLERPGQGLRHADRARERRRPRGRRLGDPPGHGLPCALPPRRRRRPRRLPALRPQRGRRAELHAAAHVQAHRGAPPGARAVRAAGSSRTASSPRRRSRPS